jgi:hypothetical protein
MRTHISNLPDLDKSFMTYNKRLMGSNKPMMTRLKKRLGKKISYLTFGVIQEQTITDGSIFKALTVLDYVLFSLVLI